MSSDTDAARTLQEIRAILDGSRDDDDVVAMLRCLLDSPPDPLVLTHAWWAQSG